MEAQPVDAGPTAAASVTAAAPARPPPTARALDGDTNVLAETLDVLLHQVKDAALARYADMKASMLADKQAALAAAASAHHDELAAKDAEIEALHRRIAASEDEAARLTALLHNSVTLYPVLRERHWRWRGSPWSVQRIVTEWRRYTAWVKSLRHLPVRARRQRDRKLRQRAFRAWAQHVNRAQLAQVSEFWEGKLDETSSDLIEGASKRVAQLERVIAEKDAELEKAARLRRSLVRGCVVQLLPAAASCVHG